MSYLFLSLLVASAAPSLGYNATGVFISPVDTYYLPSPFQGYGSIAGNLSTNFVNTVTANASINNLFQSARNATYYAFDNEFYEILGGETPEIQLVEQRDEFFAYEAGAWDYDKNQVWFTSAVLTPPTYISILDLQTNNVTTLDIPALRNINPNGGVYFGGKMYFTIQGNETEASGAAGICTIDTTTYEATIIINSFYGENFQSVDDLTWVAKATTPA